MAIKHVAAQYPERGRTKIAFVGEAPSDEELEKGAPFVGPAGRVLNSILRTANLRREDYLITNVFDEKLPQNEVANWCAGMDEAREKGFADLPPIGKAGYLRPQYRWHLDRLQDELLETRPNVIIPLGNTALWAFTGLTNVSGYRGTILPAKYLVPGAKIMPTYHPSFVIRAWEYFPVVTGDIVKAAQEAEKGRGIHFPKREIMIEPSVIDIENYVPRLLASKLLSVDIETGWGQITSIGFAPDVEHAIVIPFVDKTKNNRNYWGTLAEELDAWSAVRHVMQSDTPKLGQNFGGYDFVWLWKKYGIQPRNMAEDTRLMHHVLYPELEKSLEFMGNSYATQFAWKHWGASKSLMEKRDD